MDGSNGTLKATVDGNEINTGDKVKHGKTVTFTATPSSGYKVKEWKADDTVVAGNTSNTYTCTVTKAVHVTVSFAPSDVGSSDVGSFEDTGDGFIKITPPANGIAGIDPDYDLPGNEAYRKGVFIKDRKVKLSPYKLGKTEVTYKLWKEVYDWAVKAENGYKFANEGVKGSDGTGSEDEPVTTISWRDCIVWCNAYTQIKLGSDEQCVYRKSKTDIAVLKDATAKEGEDFICDKAYADMSKKGFRLPTEAEWEYAARWQGSNNTNAAQYGDVYLTKLNSASGAKADWNTAETGEVAWYYGNSGYKTHPVGERRANALGLHDMSGNVWEWCFDWHDTIAAENVTDPQGAASGSYRVLRGGSWVYDANCCTVGYRLSFFSPCIRNNYLGFRLACRP
ncbi:SUMF1/EgtB/PvdO family nonheme iron enzyme [Treponema denticola]|uniref:SUMF1/EgtB/PvdO family nonheme iron enzyme n=1 Tax=Treponema denticola TaxID=158 RepID=UPI003D8CA68C